METVFWTSRGSGFQIWYGHGALKGTATWKYGKIAEISVGNPLPVYIFVTGTSGKGILPVTRFYRLNIAKPNWEAMLGSCSTSLVLRCHGKINYRRAIIRITLMERKHIVVDCDDIDSDVVFGDIYKREKNISASLVLLAFRLSSWHTQFWGGGGGILTRCDLEQRSILGNQREPTQRGFAELNTRSLVCYKWPAIRE